MSKVLVALSGGMDSATVLDVAKYEGHEVTCVGFLYGSKHNAYEHKAALAVANHYGVVYSHIDVSNLFAIVKSNLLKAGEAIPEGHYDAEVMRQTVVPGRNLIFISILAAHAESNGFDQVWLGIHAGDHHIYPDCRPEFFSCVDPAVARSSDYKVDLQAPFLHHDKASILGRGLASGVPYHLTRTCYKDQPIACGKCGSCQERLEAFAKMNVADPLEYESRELMPKHG